MNEFDNNSVFNILNACDNALFYLNNANRYLSSAGSWGVVDILGGGLFSTFAKHNKMDNAKAEIESAKVAIARLKNELQSFNLNNEININTDNFLKFADYFFDGLVADWLIQSRIRDAQRQISDAISEINAIKITFSSYGK